MANLLKGMKKPRKYKPRRFNAQVRELTKMGKISPSAIKKVGGRGGVLKGMAGQ